MVTCSSLGEIKKPGALIAIKIQENAGIIK